MTKKYKKIPNDYSKQFCNGIIIPIDFLLDISGDEIITTASFSDIQQPKQKFINPNIWHPSNIDKSQDRSFKVYTAVSPYHIIELRKSGLKIFRVDEDGEFKGYLLASHKGNNMTEMKSIPRTAKVGYDDENEELKLIGENAIGEWLTIYQSSYDDKKQTLCSSNKLMTKYCEEYKLKKEKQLSKPGIKQN